MAFGFPASYETEIEATGARQVIRDAVSRTFNLLSWKYAADETANLFVARVPFSFSGYGEEFAVSFADETTIRIRSRCKPMQLFDWGKNKANIDQFLTVFWPTLSYAAAMAGPPPIYLDDSGRTPVERIIADEIPRVQADNPTDDQR